MALATVALLVPRTLQVVVPARPWGFALVSLSGQGAIAALVRVRAAEWGRKPDTKSSVQTRGQKREQGLGGVAFKEPGTWLEFWKEKTEEN